MDIVDLLSEIINRGHPLDDQEILRLRNYFNSYPLSDGTSIQFESSTTIERKTNFFKEYDEDIRENFESFIDKVEDRIDEVNIENIFGEEEIRQEIYTQNEFKRGTPLQR